MLYPFRLWSAHFTLLDRCTFTVLPASDLRLQQSFSPSSLENSVCFPASLAFASGFLPFFSLFTNSDRPLSAGCHKHVPFSSVPVSLRATFYLLSADRLRAPYEQDFSKFRLFFAARAPVDLSRARSLIHLKLGFVKTFGYDSWRQSPRFFYSFGDSRLTSMALLSHSLSPPKFLFLTLS